MSTLKEKLLSLFRKEAVSEKTNDPSCVTLYINAPLQPEDRFELEDAFSGLIGKSDMGFVDGGGTYMEESGGSYDAMAAAIQDFISEYPLCQKCVVERIA